ncbi:MAG: RNA polymerase sigma factor [Chitinophagaceae bacterium]
MTTKELIKNCLEGKRLAQELLYQQFAEIMMGVCYRYTKSAEDAEDILQEGFIKVFTKMHQFKNEGDLGAWIRKIMVNTAITYLNKHNRYKKDMKLETVLMHPVSDADPEISIDTKQLVELIRTLPSGYQTVFNLVAVEGYNLIEVAHLLNTNENTIRSRYSRSRSMIIGLLRKTDFAREKRSYADKF